MFCCNILKIIKVTISLSYNVNNLNDLFEISNESFISLKAIMQLEFCELANTRKFRWIAMYVCSNRNEFKEAR